MAVGCSMKLSERSVFPKTEVACMNGRGQPDDEVIDERDLHDLRRFAQAAGEVPVRGARLRVAGGMVVHNHEAVRSPPHNMMEHITRVRDCFVD